jgi:hypothetical protein
MDIRFAIRASCPFGCDLRGTAIELVRDDDARFVTQVSDMLAGGESGALAGQTDELSVRVPNRVGRRYWTVHAARQGIHGVEHAGAALTLSFMAEPHSTSIAVWGGTSPLRIGDAFTVEVGAKCRLGCDLSDCEVDVVDNASGGSLSSGRLRGASTDDETSLHRARFDLVAPAREGQHSWSVRLDPTRVTPAHAGSEAIFSFAVVKAADHTVTVEVVDGDTGTRLRDAHVRLGVYRATTGESGLATLGAPKGTYQLGVWKTGYRPAAVTVEVTENLTIRIATSAIPDTSIWQDD